MPTAPVQALTVAAPRLTVSICETVKGADVAVAVQPAASVTVTVSVHVPGPGEPVAAPPPVPVSRVNPYAYAPVPPLAVAWMPTAPVQALTVAGPRLIVSICGTLNGADVAVAVQ